VEAKPKRGVGIFLLLLLAVSSLRAYAIAPDWSYRVLVSPHFELIYRDTQKPLAKRYLLAAEQAYELLFPIFKEGPSHTIIFLKDDTDMSNGEAEFLPYPHIKVYPVLPSTFDSIDDFGDWAFEMIVHEYTHILNMYPAHGVYWPFKYIFGNVVRPNAILPTWYLEGLAVDMESVMSDHGRLRSSDTAAAARAISLDHGLQLESIARINQQGMSSWPFGNRPYLYGGWWWNDVQKDKGTEIIQTWNQNFSRRLPFFLNQPMIEQTGHGATELLQSTVAHLETQAQKEIATIRSSAVSEGQNIGEPDGEQTVFAISPSGKRLIYWVGTLRDGNLCQVKVRTEPGQDFAQIKPVTLFSSTSTLQVRWMNEDQVVFDAVQPNALYTSYRDLYLYDFKTNQTSVLTHGARAQEAAPGPDGRIVFIQNDGGRNHLALREANGEIRQLVNGNLFQRLSGPEFYNRDQILFTVRQRRGEESLYLYDLKTRKAAPWANSSLKNAQALRKTANGYLITDATTGVRNVYWLHNGQAEPVTNTLTDIESADYDPLARKLLISELTAQGARLRTLPFKTYDPPPVETATLPPPPNATTKEVAFKEESYQPLIYMLPQYWIPFIYQIDHGLLFQGITSGGDPAGRNVYNVSGSYDTVSKRGSYGLDYTNHSTPLDMGGGYSKFVSYLGASGLTLDSQLANVTFSSHWPWDISNENFSLGGVWYETDSSASAYRRLGPKVAWQYQTVRRAERRWLNLTVEAAHTQYLKQDGYVAYGRSYLHFANDFRLPSGQRIRLEGRGSLAPDLKSLILGDPNIGGNYAVNLTNSDFLLRGYPSGEFIGRKVVNANLEYALNPTYIEAGYGTFPFFIQTMDTVFFVDTMAVDGVGFDTDQRSYRVKNLKEFETGAGAELRFDTTLAYHLPFQVTLGAYYGFDQHFGGGFSPFFAITYGSLWGLQNKTP
jgi:hypothetical protein